MWRLLNDAKSIWVLSIFIFKTGTRLCLALFCCGYIIWYEWIHEIYFLIVLSWLIVPVSVQPRWMKKVNVSDEFTRTVNITHDDVIKWKHFPRYWPFVREIHRSPVNSSHKGQWRGALMFSLICAWINGWVNNSEAGDLRRHRAHYDVIVMEREDNRAHMCIIFCTCVVSFLCFHLIRHQPLYKYQNKDITETSWNDIIKRGI